jgi:ribonuclease P protein component
VVFHLLTAEETGQWTVGFVVGQSVGNSVQRHRVTRQLRHLMQDRMAGLPAGTAVVVRARPEAAGSTSQRLGADIDRVLDRLLAGAERPS